MKVPQNPTGRRGGHWPSVRLQAGNKTMIAYLAGRADAKTTTAILNPNWPCAEHRTSDARPYNDGVFLNYAAVGAAIGRPPVKIRSNVKQNASAKATISIVAGRASAKKIRSIFNANRPSAKTGQICGLRRRRGFWNSGAGSRRASYRPRP